MKKSFIVLALVVLFSGCAGLGEKAAQEAASADGGRLSVERTYTKEGFLLKELINYTPPKLSDDGSSIKFKDIEAVFGSSDQPEYNQPKKDYGFIYISVGLGLAVLCIGLFGYGHIKLGSLAGFAGMVVFGIYQFLDKFGALYGSLFCMGAIVMCTVAGFWLWKDYKEKEAKEAKLAKAVGADLI